jgi:hypothetical protein
MTHKPISSNKRIRFSSGIVCQLEVMKGEILVGRGWIIWEHGFGSYHPILINHIGEPLRDREGYIYNTVTNDLAVLSWSIH